MSNRKLAIRLVQELLNIGVQEFVLCPGGRNSTLVNVLSGHNSILQTFWFEERSAAFFALGRARATLRPVAVVTTSGTAAGELLPAMMEAYYTSQPLIAVTADRPRAYRGTNAPQTADQVGLFGTYAPFECDIEGDEVISLQEWNGRTPAHINLCFEEPEYDDAPFSFAVLQKVFNSKLLVSQSNELSSFLARVHSPLVIVSTLSIADRENVVEFLNKLNAPVYLEGVSGLACEKRLSHLQVIEPVLKFHDSVLRIGGIPTHRIWRDLEVQKTQISVLSISEHPFSGLSYAKVIHTQIGPYLSSQNCYFQWRYSEDFYQFYQKIVDVHNRLFENEPYAEPSLIRSVAQHLPEDAQIFLGNGMPIREWDFVSSFKSFYNVVAVRGLNGIDGQLSSFFGLCHPDRLNVAIVGDLTALYDFAAAWHSLDKHFHAPFVIIVINNKGGNIFVRRFRNPDIQNRHQLEFSAYAQFWKLNYQLWRQIPTHPQFKGLIELQPDLVATERFWNLWEKNKQSLLQEQFAIK